MSETQGNTTNTNCNHDITGIAIRYIQEYGSVPAQLFANKHQRKLIEYIGDAQEWARAKVHADAEKLSEWDMLLKAAAVGCAHAPGKCSYAAAAEEISARNAPALCKHKLAKSLRDILRNGPSKTCRVPFLAAPRTLARAHCFTRSTICLAQGKSSTSLRWGQPSRSGTLPKVSGSYSGTTSGPSSTHRRPSRYQSS